MPLSDAMMMQAAAQAAPQAQPMQQPGQEEMVTVPRALLEMLLVQSGALDGGQPMMPAAPMAGAMPPGR